MLKNIKPARCIIAALCGAFVAFGLYQVHSLSGVTEGGVLGLNLLLEHWFDISPSITNFVVTALCYLLGWRLLGREFMIYSAFAIGSFSVSYRVFEQFDRLWPQLAEYPLLAALLGAVFVGVGTGICIRAGAAICGDDALAMCISHLTRMRVQWAYLITDGIVLALSATYIPLSRLWYSLLTVVLSGQIIGFIQRIGAKNKEEN
ncbi:MAG: YitT family protein [Clostridia bacterium]|nr:YitT family protein [Clostridia bacterium]